MEMDRMELTNRPLSPSDLSGSARSYGARSPVSTATTAQPPIIPDAPIVACSRHLLQPNGSILGAKVADVLLPQFASLVDAIPRSCNTAPGCTLSNPRPALSCIDGRQAISHDDIVHFIYKTGQILHAHKIGRGHRIAVVLPNGPELALAILAISNYAACVPLNAFGASQELEADLKAAACDLVIGLDYQQTTTTHHHHHHMSHPPSTVFTGGHSNNHHHASSSSSSAHPANTGNAISEMAMKLKIPFAGLTPDTVHAGLFELRLPTTPMPRPKRFTNNNESSGVGVVVNDVVGDPLQANTHDDEILVLYTSGTTGGKKLVPHLLGDVLVATACICISWKLTPMDTNCNLMPLFHVGGIIRQVFSPILSAGCVICCPSFDPQVFWQLIMARNKGITSPTSNAGSSNADIHLHADQQQPPSFTWYYAAPTMHQLILQYGKAEGYIGGGNESKGGGRGGHGGGGGGGGAKSSSSSSPETPKLRMIANAAGGLLPSLARELRRAFHANVLPSYGMTECMPISSPPANYQLEKPGTSGVAVGPEMCIWNEADSTPILNNPGKEGPICVRGKPCFRGYGVIYDQHDNDNNNNNNGNNGTPPQFLPGGWFNTGDLGYIDADGYLFITGRSKEVINRGGEIISPLEVEEAVNSHPHVLQAVAFSTPHDLLQEVVGILLVPEPGRPRIDLPTLHDYLGQGRLAAPKWPQCLVYMEESGSDGCSVPKSHTNKLLRVKLAQRLGLPELNDGMYFIERTFIAKCPKIGTPVSVAISCQRVTIDATLVEQTLRLALQLPPLSMQALQQLADNQQQQALSLPMIQQQQQQQHDGHRDLIVVPHPSKLGHLVVHVYNISRIEVVRTAQEKLDAYAVPSHIVDMPGPSELTELAPPQPSDAIGSIVLEATSFGLGPTDPLVSSLQELFQNMLDLDCLPAPDTSFFNLGGSSMLASQLASKIRKLHNVPFGGAEVFHHVSCTAIASIIRDRRDDESTPVRGIAGGGSRASSKQDKASLAASSLFSKNIDLAGVKFDPTRIPSESGIGASLVQLLPMFLIYPVWQLSRFYLFFRLLLHVLVHVPDGRNLIAFVLTLVGFHLLWVTITPLLFVAIKWTIVGTYRKGRYPLWGSVYLRWWLVDVMRKLIGRGVWGTNEYTLNAYYRLCGATIGHGARISLEAEIAEYDLVFIGDGAAVEYATVRGFGVDNGCMILGPVVVGSHASVGTRAVVAPYTNVPDHAHLGPATSSYEINAVDPSGGESIKHLRYNRYALPTPSILSVNLFVSPIIFICDTISHIPALTVLYWLVKMPWYVDRHFQTIDDLMQWLCDVRRIPFYIGIRVARAIIAPHFYMFSAVLVKWLVIGKFQPGPRDTTSEWQLIRHDLAHKLFSREKMQDFTELIGRHYELVSILYRLLGAKVGKRVFWPGHQPVFSGEFDLLEIGDDVVFGSRAVLLCTTADSCEKITLCAGSNVSDNTVVLPGSIIGKNAVLGSNSVCPEGRYLPEASVWFGSRGGEPVMLEKGLDYSPEPVESYQVPPEKVELQGDESTIRPFGKAIYMGEANYIVLPIFFMILFTAVVQTVVATVHTIPVIGALNLSAGYIYGYPLRLESFDDYTVTDSEAYTVLLVTFIGTNAIRVFVWLLVELSSKWILMGRRQEGRYNYDQSSYAQNWELYQIIGHIRNVGRMNLLDFISGTPFMSAFFRLLGANVGENCCLYPASGDPYMPEPDLVDMGNNCVIDCASVVCHLNTRGNFELKKITMENNVTLRTRARIQQGVHMEMGSMMLEKSLAMTGEVIDAESVWVGAPAARLVSYDTSSLGSRASMQDVMNNNNVVDTSFV